MNILENPGALPPWLPIALAEFGVREYPGEDDNNPRILEYMSCLRRTTESSRDETPWCSAFVAWCLMQGGIRHQATAVARSWLNQLETIHVPRLGCVAVFWRKKKDSWMGHVGFVVGAWGNTILLLGGNQGNQVSVLPYSSKRILGFRFPDMSAPRSRRFQAPQEVCTVIGRGVASAEHGKHIVYCGGAKGYL